MNFSDHLMERFFSGDCTEEEKKQVVRFFKDNSEKLVQYLSEESWENFIPDARSIVPTHTMRQTIESRVGRPPVKKLMNRWAAAASVALLAGLGAWLYWTAAGKDKYSSTPPVAAARMVEKKEITVVLQMISNESAKTGIYSLPDGTRVKLSGNSAVSFNNPFIGKRRDVYLKGEAVFIVAKDKSRPFSVHSKGMVTTALGTTFSINDKYNMFATVHLYSGRIVVKKEESDSGKSFGDIYLTPGQELVLNKEDFSVRVKTIDSKPPAGKIETAPLQPNILNFNKQPLTNIFALLQREYKITISFDALALKNIDFTGVFDAGKESLESFLSTLCELNELKLKKTAGNRFSILTQ